MSFLLCKDYVCIRIKKWRYGIYAMVRYQSLVLSFALYVTFYGSFIFLWKQVRLPTIRKEAVQEVPPWIPLVWYGSYYTRTAASGTKDSKIRVVLFMAEYTSAIQILPNFGRFAVYDIVRNNFSRHKIEESTSNQCSA